MATRGTIGLVNIGTPSVKIGGISDSRLSTGLARVIEGADGAVDPNYVSVMDVRPTLTFTTRQLTALASAGISGATLAAFDAWYQTLLAYGTRHATSKKLSIAQGFLVPRTLTAREGAFAELVMEAIAISTDGIVNPATFGTGSMPAEPTAVRWTIGPVSLNGSSFIAESVTVDFGLSVEVEASDGHAYPTFASIMTRQPTIRISSKEFDAGSTFGVPGTAQSATDSVISFRKLAHGGTRVADETAEHVTITVDDGLISFETFGASQGQRAITELVLTPTYDGTAAIMVLDTAAAIT